MAANSDAVRGGAHAGISNWHGYQRHLDQGEDALADVDHPVRSGINLIKLVLVVLIGAFVGASIMCDGGISVGGLFQASMEGQLEMHITEIFIANGADVLGVGALIGAICGGFLYLLAIGSPQHHGKNRPGGEGSRMPR